MARFGLVFRPSYNLVVCTACNVAVGKSFWDHLLKVHDIIVDAGSRPRIQRDVTESPYLLPQQPFLEAVDFRPILPGFKCSTCEYYSANSDVAKRHARSHDPIATVVDCSVQRMNNSKKTPYVGVRAGENHAEEVRADAQAANVVGGVDAVTATRAFKNRIELEVEEGSRLNLFYELSGFLAADQLALFAEVAISEYIKCPEEQDDDKALFDFIRDELMDAIDGVNGLDTQLRFQVSPSRRPFKKLQNLSSIQDYSLVMVRFIRFLVCLVENPIDNVVIPENIEAAITEFILGGDLKAVFNIIIEILTLDPRLSLP